MGDDEHPVAAMMQADRVKQTPQTQDGVAPTLAAGRPVIELAEQATKFRLFWKLRLDPDTGEPVEDAKLLFAQTLVDTELGVGARQASRGADRLAGLHGPNIG